MTIADDGFESLDSQILRRVEFLGNFIRLAEDKLGIDEGSIIDLEDPDFVLILKVHATLEPLLRESLLFYLESSLEGDDQNFRGMAALKKVLSDLNFDARKKLAVEFGIIDKDDSDFIDAIAKIRNRYVHHIANISLSTVDIIDKIASDSDGRIYKKIVPPGLSSGAVDDGLIKMMLYIRVAGLLRKFMMYYP